MKTVLLSRISQQVGNLRVTTKLRASFGIMVALTILVSMEGIFSARMLEAHSSSLFNEDLSGISAIKEAGLFQAKCSRVLRDIVLASGNKDAITDQKGELSELEASVDEWLTAAQHSFTDSKSQAKLAEIRAQVPALNSLSDKVAALAMAGQQQEALAALKKNSSISNHMNRTIAEICRLREDTARESSTVGKLKYRRSSAVMVGCTLFSILFAGALCLLTERMIAGPLMQVMKTLQKASEGDFTERLTVVNRDEIGRMSLALNEALESTRAVLQKAIETASDVGAISAELASTAAGIADGAQSQAAGIEQTSASLEEITVTARNNAEHARRANSKATLSSSAADKGRAVVMDAIKAMEDINASSERISEIASSVDEIAFQTNLLSVNAAIEAARAGVEGKTFGVVAEEIRHLSKRSAESARGIRELIRDSIRVVKNGSSSIQHSGETLKGLSSSVNEVTDLIAQIVAASEEQSLGVEQVNTAVSQMDRVTQMNASQAANLSDTAANLSSQAAKLQAMLNRFTLDMNSEASPEPIGAEAL